MQLTLRDNGTLTAAGPEDVNFAGEDADDGIVRRLLRRKWLFAFVFALVLAIIGGAYAMLSPIYQAEATVTVAAPDPILASQQTGGAQLTIGDTADLETQAAILSSPMVLRAALERPAIHNAVLDECKLSAPPEWKLFIKSLLHLGPSPSCETVMEDTTRVINGMRGSMAVSTAGRSRVLVLSYSSHSPEIAKAIADGIVQTYLDLGMAEKLQPREKAIQWLRDETKNVSDRLKRTEAQIQAFLQQQGVIRGQSAPLASEQLTGLAQQINLAEAERAAAAGRMQQSESASNVNTGVMGSRTVGDVKSQLTTVNSQIALLSTRYGDATPALIELNNQRRALMQILSQETGAVNRSAITDYQAANSRVTALRQELEGLKQEVRSNTDAATQVAALEREMVTDRELYVDLTKNLNQLQTNMRLVTPNAQLVSWAEVPQAVFFPKRSVFALTGLILATGLAGTAALLRDRIDRKVRTIGGLQFAVNLRVLTSIPYLSRIGRKPRQLISMLRRPSAFQEAIRSLYAECLLVSPQDDEHALRTVLVTSPDRGEGKTFTALAFANFAAVAGQRVLLLECDLRQPSIRDYLDLENQAGVTSILRGRAAAAETVQRIDETGLDIISAGPSAADSAELLAGPRMKELLAWAKQAYDLIVIDTPPSGILPDARILAPSVDGVLCCVQWGRSRVDAVTQCARDIAGAGGRVLGLVLDRAQGVPYELYQPQTRQKLPFLAHQET